MTLTLELIPKRFLKFSCHVERRDKCVNEAIGSIKTLLPGVTISLLHQILHGPVAVLQTLPEALLLVRTEPRLKLSC